MGDSSILAPRTLRIVRRHKLHCKNAVSLLASLNPFCSWPSEVNLCIAKYVHWRELLANARLCSTWYDVTKIESLWCEYFSDLWPRLAKRKTAIPTGSRNILWS